MRPAIPRSFLLQASLALLPVILLAALGWHLVQRDRATVIEEARREAQRLAPQIARFVAEGLVRRMEGDLEEVRRRSDRLPAVDARISWPVPTISPAGRERRYNVLKSQFHALQESRSASLYGRVFDGSYDVISVVDAEGRLIFPKPFSELPLPATGKVTKSTADNAADGVSQLVAEIGALDRDAVQQRLTEFLAAAPTASERDQARFAAALRLIALDEPAGARDLLEQVAVEDAATLSEGGLPLPVLAGYQLAELLRPTTTNGLPSAEALSGWHRAVERAATLVVLHPSAISVPLLERLGSAGSDQLDEMLRRELTLMRERWTMIESTLEFHQALEDNRPDAASVEALSAPLWLRWRDLDWWVAFAPEHRERTIPPVTRFGVFPFSRLSFELAVPELLAESDVLLPAGLAVRFEVDGRVVGEQFQAAELMGSAESLFQVGGPAKYFGFDGYFAETPAGRLRAEVVLAQPEILLALQRERSRWLFAIIGGSFLVSLIGMGAMFRSHRRQMELSLAKDNFVSSVSHELRAPIASVRLMAENLERGKVAGADKLQEYVRFIGQECRRLSALIENVLDFGRIEQGRKQYEFEPTDLGKLVAETVRLMQPYAEERGVKLELEGRHSCRPAPSEGRIHPPNGPHGHQADKQVTAPTELLEGRHSCRPVPSEGRIHPPNSPTSEPGHLLSPALSSISNGGEGGPAVAGSGEEALRCSEVQSTGSSGNSLSAPGDKPVAAPTELPEGRDSFRPAPSEGRIHPPSSPQAIPGDRNVAFPLELNLDGRAIQQALINLIDNAIKHSPGGATVTIELTTTPNSKPETRTISVTDHGPGIPREEHEKIFERFYRRGSELRRETQGIGIGLSIVKHIVEAHGGRVWVESEPGKGSRFVIQLTTDR